MTQHIDTYLYIFIQRMVKISLHEAHSLSTLKLYRTYYKQFTEFIICIYKNCKMNYNLWIDQKFSAIPESYTFFSYSSYIYIWLFQSFAYAFITLSLFQGYDYVFSRDNWRTSAFSHVVGKNPGIWVWGDRFVLLVFGMCACVCTKYSTLGGVSTPSSMPAYKPTEDFVSA